MEILEGIFREPDRQSEKRKAKRRIYGANYLALADKYFGYQMNEDARRCYLQALRYQPDYLLRSEVLRHLLGTTMGRKTYEITKSALKSLSSKIKLP